MRPPVVLLPPSEGKAPGGSGAWDPARGAFGVLVDERRAVAEALARLPDKDAAKVLGVGGAHLDRALAANHSLVGGPVLPARLRYTGVVHLAAGLAGLGRRESGRVVVVSALLGAAALGDPVPDYRLKMGARLPALGRLATWWRPRLAPVLDARCRGRVVVDLLPGDHAAAFDAAASTARRVVRARFERGGRVIGHEAKTAKGLLARHVLLAGDDALAAIATFGDDGWSLDRAASDLEGRVAVAVFTRP